MTSRLASGRSTVSPNPVPQRPKPQGPLLFQPRRTDPARRPPASRLQYRWSPPRRPTAAPRPILSRHPIPTTRPSAPSRRHQARPRHLSLLSHPRWPRRHRCRPPPHRTHHHSCFGLTNLLTRCKHSARKRLTPRAARPNHRSQPHRLLPNRSNPPRYELPFGLFTSLSVSLSTAQLRSFDTAAPPPTQPSQAHSSAFVSDPPEWALADRRGAPQRWLSGRAIVPDQRLRSSAARSA